MKTPQWITDYIAYWKPTLYLQEWTITTEVVDKPGDIEDAYCHVVTEADYLRAKIQFASFVPEKITSGAIDHYDKSMWERYILHELIHIRTANVVDFARDTFSRGFSTGEYVLLDERLRVETERMTTMLTEVMFQLSQPNPEEALEELAELLIKRGYEGEPDPNLVHPGGLVVPDYKIMDLVELKEDGTFLVRPGMEVEYHEWEQKQLEEGRRFREQVEKRQVLESREKFGGFDNGNFVVEPPADMGDQVEAWSQKLKDSMKGDSNGES